MLRRLYDWCIQAAEKKSATWILGGVSFAESSFFPVPPDVMLIPMSLARPDKAYHYAFICTLTSVAGGIVGYLIGALLYDSLGQWVIQLYGYGEKIERSARCPVGVPGSFCEGLTPIPYKLVTITSGFAGYNFFWFVVLSLITRGARFYLLAFLLHRYGPWAREIIEKRLGLWTAIGAAALVGGFLIVYGIF